jgi:hypothetical protein
MDLYSIIGITFMSIGHILIIINPFKGIVQPDLKWVETRLKRSVLINYIVAKFAF